MNNSFLSNDLDHVMNHTGHYWEELRVKRIFLTGGTGFIGCWLFETLLRAYHQYDLIGDTV